MREWQHRESCHLGTKNFPVDGPAHGEVIASGSQDSLFPKGVWCLDVLSVVREYNSGRVIGLIPLKSLIIMKNHILEFKNIVIPHIVVIWWKNKLQSRNYKIQQIFTESHHIAGKCSHILGSFFFDLIECFFPSYLEFCFSAIKALGLSRVKNFYPPDSCFINLKFERASSSFSAIWCIIVEEKMA